MKVRPAVISAIDLFKDNQFSGKATTMNIAVLFIQGAGAFTT